MAHSSSIVFEGWKILEESNQFLLAQNIEDQKTFVAVTISNDDKLIDLTRDLNQIKVNQLIEQRKRAMNFVSVKKWNDSKTIWKNNEIKIEGSYIDHKGKKVEFIEYHRYLKEKSIQILFTSPKIKTIDTASVLKNYEVTLR